MRRAAVAAVMLLLAAIPLGLEANLRQSAGCPSRLRAAAPCEQFAPAMDAASVAERAALLTGLRDRRGDVAAEQAVAARLAQQVSAEALGANGVACASGAFVVIREGLSGPARRYVLQHELEHLLVPERSEAETNFAAARAVPIGMAATVAESVWLVARGEGTAGCKLARMWAGFRTYFIGISS